MLVCQSRGPDINPGQGPGISEIIFVVFPAISDRLDCISIWLKAPWSCVSVLHTGHIKEPCCLFEIRARRTLQRRTCLYQMSLSLSLPSMGFLSVCPSGQIMLYLHWQRIHSRPYGCNIREDYVKRIWTCFRMKRALCKSRILLLSLGRINAMYINNIDHILIYKESGVLLTAVNMIMVSVSKFLIHGYIGYDKPAGPSVCLSLRLSCRKHTVLHITPVFHIPSPWNYHM